MRSFIFILFLFLSKASTHAGDTTLTQVRELYKSAVNKKESCEKLLSISGQYSTDNNLTITAYNACATMMMANYVYNPISKLSYFNKGKKLLEKCIKTNQNNIETRFLRFTIQTKSPPFLGYNNAIESDKLFLLTMIEKIDDKQLKLMILSFLKSSEHLTPAQKQQLNT